MVVRADPAGKPVRSGGALERRRRRFDAVDAGDCALDREAARRQKLSPHADDRHRTQSELRHLVSAPRARRARQSTVARLGRLQCRAAPRARMAHRCADGGRDLCRKHSNYGDTRLREESDERRGLLRPAGGFYAAFAQGPAWRDRAAAGQQRTDSRRTFIAMEIRNVCVIGGAGFVGRHITHLLSARGFEVTVPTRSRERAKELILLPAVDVVDADVHDAATLERLTRDADAVINLVGVLHDGRGRQSFAEAHVALARKVVAACQKNNVQRPLQMSALNADTAGPSAYLRSKGEAEAIVRESGVKWTIFRPSVIFGRDDKFLNLFARMLKLMPVMVLASPHARFQPVFVEDDAQAFVHS